MKVKFKEINHTFKPEFQSMQVVKPVIQPLEVTKNGEYTVPAGVHGFNPVKVEADGYKDGYTEGYKEGYDKGYPEGYEASQDSITLQEKTTTENGEITADEGYTGLSKVTVDVPERKEEQTKALEATENGSYDIFPDEGKVLSSASVNVNVQDKALAEIESLIDESGVLDSTEGTVEEKVEQLVDLAQWEDFWYKASGNWTSQFVMLFYKATNIKKLPRLNFQNATSLSEFMTSSTIESVDYYINSGNVGVAQSPFVGCKNLTFFYGIDLTNCKSADLFKNCSLLETIQEPLDMSGSGTDGHFIGCYSLKNIRFVANTLKKSLYLGQLNLLTPESIQSIIDGLATVTTAQTLTLHKDITLTDEQKATINSKGWTLAQ